MDNQVHGSGKVNSWKTCTKPMGANSKKLYNQKRDHMRSTVAIVYKTYWKKSLKEYIHVTKRTIESTGRERSTVGKRVQNQWELIAKQS